METRQVANSEGLEARALSPSLVQLFLSYALV